MTGNEGSRGEGVGGGEEEEEGSLELWGKGVTSRGSGREIWGWMGMGRRVMVGYKR